MGRLIGFNVVISEGAFAAFSGSKISIRSIQPIFDGIDCAGTTIDSSAIEAATFSIEIGAGSVTFTLEATDSLSDSYGNMDGVTYCGP